MLHAGITTPGFIQNLRERGEEERMDANEKGRDEKGTSGSRAGVHHLQKDAVHGKDEVAK